MALSSANRCYDFPLAEPGQSKRRARFFCVDGRKRSDAGQVRVRGGSDGKYGNAVLTPHSDRNGRGVRGARNGALSTDSQQKKSRSERREHPARSCPNVE